MSLFQARKYCKKTLTANKMIIIVPFFLALLLSLTASQQEYHFAQAKHLASQHLHQSQQQQHHKLQHISSLQQHLHQNQDHNNQHQQQSQQQPISECARRPNVCQNGATCVTKPGGDYQCICVNGWEGQNCTENVNDCTNAACENGGTCHDRVGSFYCECSPGKTGLLCQHDDGCFSSPCHPNATCDTSPVDGRAICTCPPGFIGTDCSIDNDECAAGSPCEHGGTCVNEPGTFRCECAQGFTGTRCEVNIDECAENPCVNGATCLDEQGGFRCICPVGFAGRQCEIDVDECASNPCENGATCKDERGTFRCLCPAGFWGQRCEFNASNSAPPAIDTPYLSPGNPWSNCPTAFLCWTFFSDGKCDPTCNIAECLYDGKDCSTSNEEMNNMLNSNVNNNLSSSSNNNLSGNGAAVNQASGAVNQQQQQQQQNGANNNNNSNNNNINSNRLQPLLPATSKICDDKDSFCLRNYANGVCDQECNSAECGWDGLDCESQQQLQPINGDLAPAISSTRAQGLLVIRVEPPVQLGTDPESKDEITKLLRNLYSVTKTVLKIQSYKDVDEGRGTEIELIADNRRCLSSCFNSTDLIARFLTALRSKRPGFNTTMSAGLKINNIYSRANQGDQYEPDAQQSMASTVWVIVCGSLATVCTVLMVISIGNKQRETKKAFNWFPEGFKTTTKTPRRDVTNRKGSSGGLRGISTLSAVSGNFIRGFKGKERNVSTDPNGLHSTDIDRHRAAATTPSVNGGIYHEPYDYDQYGSTYIGAESIVNEQSGNVGHHQMSTHKQQQNHHHQPMTPTPPMSLNPINIEGPHGMTPLMVASMGVPFSKDPLGLVTYGTTGEVDASAENNNVTDLLNRGAQLNLASKVTGETALHLAARCGRADNASRLLAHCDSKDVNAKDATGRTPLHAAIAADSLGVFELLIRNRGTDLNAQTHDGTTPLILAAKVGNYSMLEELIQNECEVTKSDANGKTALHWAAAVNNVDIMRRLLAVRETNKDAQDLAEETPLFLAAREGARGAVEILLSHNANKDIKDQLDVSPMEIARSKKHDDIVRLLEEYEPTTPRSLTSINAAHHSRQISPLSPDSTSNSNQSTLPAPPPYLSYTHLSGNIGATNLSEGGRKAQRAAAATLPDAYSVPCLKNFMTPSPDSPYSLDSMVSPPVGYTSQQYQNLHQAVITSTKQAGVFI